MLHVFVNLDISSDDGGFSNLGGIFFHVVDDFSEEATGDVTDACPLGLGHGQT